MAPPPAVADLTPGRQPAVASPPAAGGPGAAGRRVVVAARTAVVVAALVPVAMYLYVALHQLGYPYELEWMEGGAAEIVSRVLHGQAIYVQPSLHYVPYAYPPLYFWVSAAVAHVTGMSFLPLRLVSFLSSLGCMALLARLVWRETRDPAAGVVAAGLFAASWVAGGAWLDIGRVDSLWLLLLLAAIATARRARTWRGGLMVGLLALAAFMTKQTALLAMAPLLAYLVVTRRRVGLSAAGSLCAGVVVSTVVLDATSGGWYQYYVFTELLHQGIVRSVFTHFFTGDLLAVMGWALALGLAGAAVGWRHRCRGGALTTAVANGGTGGAAADGDTDGPPMAWAFWMAAVAGLVGASWASRLHSGGARDVLIPAYAGVALLAGLGYGALGRSRAGRHHRVAVSLVLAAVVALQVVWLTDNPTRLIPDAADLAAGQQFIARVATTPGQVIVLDHPWYETLAGKPSWAQDEAVHDVLRGGPSAARTDLLRSIRQSLASPDVTAVYLDGPVDAGLQRPIDRYFRPGGRVFSCYRCFFPATDVAFRPYLEYVRR